MANDDVSVIYIVVCVELINYPVVVKMTGEDLGFEIFHLILKLVNILRWCIIGKKILDFYIEYLFFKADIRQSVAFKVLFKCLII